MTLKLTNQQRAMIHRRSREAAGLCIYCPVGEVQRPTKRKRGGKWAKGCRDCLDVIAMQRRVRREERAKARAAGTT